MIELGGGAGFLVEALDVFGVHGQVRRQDLQGDAAVELGIAGAQHGRHAADADRLEQLEVGQPAAVQVIGGGGIGGRGGAGTVLGDDCRRFVGDRRGFVQEVVAGGRDGLFFTDEPTAGWARGGS